MNRIFKYALMFCFVAITLFAISQMSDGAEAADCTWEAESGNLASTATNWENGTIPQSGDNVYLITGTCQWDISPILIDFKMSGGSLEGITNNQIICSSDFIQTSGSIVDSTIIINMTGTGVCIINQGIGFDIINSGNITLERTAGSVLWANKIWNTGIINIHVDTILRWVSYSTLSICTNSGIINGPGTFNIFIYNKDVNFSGGIFNVDITITLEETSNSQKIMLSNNLINHESILIYSSHASNSITFDLNDKTLSIKEFYSSTRCIMDFNGTIEMIDTGFINTIFQIENITFSGITTLTNSINVNSILVLNGQWIGNIYYNGTADISTDQQHWTGWLYTQNDVAIEYNAYAYLEFSHDDWLGIQLESWSGTDNFTWNATSISSQTVQWSWSRGEANAMYDEYMDTIYIGSDETNAGGMGEFTSTIVGTHAFLLSRSTFLPASTDIDDSVWLAILFMCIATLINFVGYARKIGLLQIVSFLVLLVGIFTAADVWTELWTLPTLFILSNAVIFIMGMMRKS